jgi:hypothetical protein
MRRSRGIASGVITIGALVGAIWACDKKSPTEPTPPVPCTFTLSSSALTFGASGGSASVTVTTAATCAWTALSDRGWMTIGSGASGTGPGTVAVTVTANTNSDARSGTLTIAGQAVDVRQDGATPCTVSLSPASAAFGKDAATGSFTVTAAAACAWTAGTGDAWITITAGASGTGTAVVTYAIARNTSVTARTGTIRVGAATFSIVQQGDTPAPVCEFRVSPVLLNACMAVPYELSVSVATAESCGWTVTSDTPWIALGGASSRSGPGEIRFRIGDNYDAPRLGVVKVRWDTPTAGQNVQVSQAGCRYAVSTPVMNVPAAGGTHTFDVYQQSDPLECGGPLQNGCVWTAATGAAWIAIISPMPRKGDDQVSFGVAPNPGAARSATINVRDKTVLVLQAGS